MVTSTLWTDKLFFYQQVEKMSSNISSAVTFSLSERMVASIHKMPINDAPRTDIKKEFSSAEERNFKRIAVHKDGNKSKVSFSLINLKIRTNFRTGSISSVCLYIYPAYTQFYAGNNGTSNNTQQTSSSIWTYSWSA